MCLLKADYFSAETFIVSLPVFAALFPRNEGFPLEGTFFSPEKCVFVGFFH